MKNETRNAGWIQPRAVVVTGIVILTAMLRIIPHPMNFAPIGATALFGGAYFSSKRSAMAVPLLSLAAGDLIAGFHVLIPWVYASFLVSVAIGFWLRREKSAARIGVAVLSGAAQFFLVTNFALWASSIGSYPRTSTGLLECYGAGLPLFGNTLAGDAFYAGLLFGGMAVAEKRFPSLRKPLTATAAEN